ncbi:MAG: hypothetical protein ACE5HX_05575, partial [bacterium]
MNISMSVLMIFIDGIGIGEYDEEKNPFARFPSLYFSKFINQYSQPPPFAGCIVPTDPSMGGTRSAPKRYRPDGFV